MARPQAIVSDWYTEHEQESIHKKLRSLSGSQQPRCFRRPSLWIAKAKRRIPRLRSRGLASGEGTDSVLPWISANSKPCSRWRRRAVALE